MHTEIYSPDARPGTDIENVLQVLGDWGKVQFIVHHFQIYVVLQIYPYSTPSTTGTHHVGRHTQPIFLDLLKGSESTSYFQAHDYNEPHR